MSKKSNRYSFPILEPKAIIKIFKELGIAIASKDLKEPTEERFKAIYSHLLHTLMGVDFNQRNQMQFRALDTFQYPELHEQSMTQIGLLRTLIKFMQRVGVKDFSMSDLIMPNPKRTIRNLSAIINFAKFRQDKCSIYAEYKDKERELRQEFAAAEKKNDALAHAFANLKTACYARAPDLEKLKGEEIELKNMFEQKANENAIVKESYQSKKRDLSELQFKQKQLQQEINSCDQQIISIRSKIVQSPDKIRTKLQEAQDEANRKMAELEALNHKITVLISKNKTRTELATNLQNLVATLEETAKYKEKVHEYETQIREMNRELDSLESDRQKLITTEKSLQKQVNDEKKKYDEQRETAKQESQLCLEHRQQTRKKQQMLETKIQQIETQIQKLNYSTNINNQKIKEWEEKHEEYMQQLFSEMTDITQYIRQLQQKYSQALSTDGM